MKLSYLAIPLLIFLIFISNLLSAAEPLVFKETTSPSIRNLIKLTMNSEAANEYLVSNVDLNKDGRDEYIIKRQACSSSMCNYKVIGLNQKDKPLILLNIDAKSILASDQMHLGIRNILVHDKPDNDFATSLYIWDTQASRYILKK